MMNTMVWVSQANTTHVIIPTEMNPIVEGCALRVKNIAHQDVWGQVLLKRMIRCVENVWRPKLGFSKVKPAIVIG